MILTKDKILQGIDTPKKVMITSMNGELWLRPLSSAEVNEVMNIEAKGFGTFDASNNRGQTMANAKMNLAKVQESQAEAKYIAIHKSINNPKNDEEWEIDELKQLPHKAINEIYDKVMELSGVDVTEGDVKQFPETE